MNRNLYALLVGINDYPKEHERLKGCVNDVNAVENYLNQRLADKLLII
ncbi:hypothetical protein PL11201_530201 [Planktothrix sp. PCC 11201]|nr:hypothetical protein PL11201_530201 [Planktothrix sp. PCC 11201]